MTFNEACQTIANELVELICKKQHDYGHSNINAFGELGLVIRTNDKITRLRTLIGKEGITEPRIDAWRDIAGYAIIALMLDRDWFKLELDRRICYNWRDNVVSENGYFKRERGISSRAAT